MALFQGGVRQDQAGGQQGDLTYWGPQSIVTAPFEPGGNPNVFGHAFTRVVGSSIGAVEPGGLGPYVGILVNPKEFVSRGGPFNGLAVDEAIQEGAYGQFLVQGYMYVDSRFSAGPEGSRVFFGNLFGNLAFSAGDHEIPNSYLVNSVVNTGDVALCRFNN